MGFLSKLQQSIVKVKELTIVIMEIIGPHFKKEEDTLLNPDFAVEVDETSQIQMDKEISRRIRSEGQPTKVFPYLAFHLTPEERADFFSLPWFVKVVVFPFFTRRYAASWVYAPFATRSESGRYRF